MKTKILENTGKPLKLLSEIIKDAFHNVSNKILKMHDTQKEQTAVLNQPVCNTDTHTHPSQKGLPNQRFRQLQVYAKQNYFPLPKVFPKMRVTFSITVEMTELSLVIK